MKTLSIRGGYSVRSDGVVLGKLGKPLSAWEDQDGYSHVTLHLVRGKNPKRFAVHRLVALAFKGPPPSRNHQVRHLDGDRQNNRATNIAWGTPQENSDDTRRHGSLRGARNPNTRLTPKDIQRVLAMRRSGMSQQRIADTLGIGQSHVSRILMGEHWLTAGAA